MSQGKIEQIGTPDEIYDEPNSPFVFSFIGESSALPVEVEKGKVWLDEHPLDVASGEMPDGPAQLFFRPHDVEVGERPARRHSRRGIGAPAPRGGARRVELEVGLARRPHRDRASRRLPAQSLGPHRRAPAPLPALPGA